MEFNFYMNEKMERMIIAVSDRDAILRDDDAPLQENDLVFLKENTDCREVYVEKENGITVLPVNKDAVIPEGYKRVALRQMYADMGEDDVLPYFRAKALAEWTANTRFCPRCGTRLVESETQTAMVCPDCKNIVFPRIDPCIIVLVNKGDKILLARHVQRNQDIYACIAGFMEVGESVEQCVRREIMEETGLKVKNIKYYGSQSWPFPQQMMLGFTAEYESGELKLQEEELSDAKFFDRDKCPANPRPGSIAYRMIHEPVVKG